MGEQNEGWLDLSGYPDLSAEDAVDEATRIALHSILTAPDVPPLDPATWQQAVAAAVRSTAGTCGDLRAGGFGGGSAAHTTQAGTGELDSRD